METKGTRHPAKGVYALVAALVSLYVRTFKQHRLIGQDVKRHLPDGAFLVVGNHTCTYDFLYMMRCLFPKPVHFIVADKYFHFQRPVPWILGYAGAIPKSQSKADLRTITRSRAVIRAGGVLGIFPEGRISMGGLPLPLPAGLGKFVKLLGVPVYAVRTFGGAFVNPPWSPFPRKGPVTSQMVFLLGQEEVQRMEGDEIEQRIREALSRNSYDWQQAKGCRYQGRDLTAGLDHLLYLCPDCGREFSLLVDSGHIECQNCGLSVDMDGSGHFSWPVGMQGFVHMGAWYQWQSQMAAELAAKDGISWGGPARLFMYKEGKPGKEAVGHGTILMTKEGFSYQGSIRGQETKLLIQMESIWFIPYTPGRSFQIWQDGELLEFHPEPGAWAVKYALLGEALHFAAASGEKD